MLVDFSCKLLGLNGEPLVDERDAEKSVLLRDVVVTALLSAYPEERVDGAEKVARYQLAMRVQGASEALELSAKDVTKIKDLVGKCWTPLIVGQAWQFIEPEEN